MAPNKLDSKPPGTGSDSAVERRGFLKTAVVGAVGAAASASTGCGTLLPPASSPAPALDPKSLDEFLSRFDAGLADIGSRSVLGPLVPPDRLAKSETLRKYVEDGDRTSHRLLRGLFVAGMYGDLPDETRRDPRVRERIDAVSPDLDLAIGDATERLSSLTDDELQGLQRALRAEPDAVMNITEAIDTHARQIGVPLSGRTKLRAAATHVAVRMKQQPPSLLIGQYVDKVQRVAASNASDAARQRELSSQTTEQMFWSEDLPPGGAAAQPFEQSYWPESDPQPQVSQRRKSGKETMNTGASMLGVGVLVFGVSALAVSAGAFGFVFGATAGVVLAIIGLVVLIIGAASASGA